MGVLKKRVDYASIDEIHVNLGVNYTNVVAPIIYLLNKLMFERIFKFCLSKIT